MFTNAKHHHLISELLMLAALLLMFLMVGCAPENTPTPQDTTSTESPAPPTTPVAEVSEPSIPLPVEPTPEPEAEPLPEPPREVTFADAEAAYHEGDYEGAVDLFSQYTEQHAANAWGFYMLGLSSWKAGDLEEAEQAFIEALRLDETHVKSWTNLSRVHLDAQKPADAVAALQEALAFGGDTYETYRLQGRALHQMGEHDAAVTAYQEALMRYDKDAWSMNNLGLVYIEEEAFDQAASVLALAVETRSDIALFYNNLGMALEHLGQFVAAADAYQAALDLNAEYTKAIDNLARVESVEQDPLLEPVDLAALAERFVEEMTSWQKEEVAQVEADGSTAADASLNTSVERDASTPTLSETADSTGYVVQADSTQHN